MSKHYYPESLKEIVHMIEWLNEYDKNHEGGCVMFGQNIEVLTSDGEVIGYLRDEVGGAWSFYTERIEK